MSSHPVHSPATFSSSTRVKKDLKEDTAKQSASRKETAPSFSVLGSIGGPLGIVESITPTLVFLVAYLILDSVTIPVICSACVSLVFFLYRLIRHQKIRSAIMGIILAAICAIAALATGQARNYYAPGFFVNGFWLIVLLASLAFKTPGLGLIVQVFNQPLEGGFAAWRKKWATDPQLYRAYCAATWMWVGVFALRLGAELPLWVLHLSTALGVVRLVTGIPLFALVVWLTWVVVHPVLAAHKADGTDVSRTARKKEH